MKQIEFKSKLKGTIYTVNLNLRTRITFISDLSGTGKTLVRKLATKEDVGIVGFGSSDIRYLKALLSEGRFNFKDKLVIVDNAEYLLSEIPELQDCINYDRENHYLVFIRQTSINIAASPKSIARLKFNKSTNTFYIEYVYAEGVWA